MSGIDLNLLNTKQSSVSCAGCGTVSSVSWSSDDVTMDFQCPVCCMTLQGPDKMIWH